VRHPFPTSNIAIGWRGSPRGLASLILAALAAAVLLLAPGAPLPAHDPVFTAREAAVAAAHPEAGEVGAAVLKGGGNAVDAAVAVGMALAVVYPRAGNLGGGGFLLYRDPEGEVHALDFREKAPLLATRNMYLDESGEVVAGASTRGRLAAGVPGTVAGLARALEAWGTGEWADLVAPAWSLARGGFPVDAVLAGDSVRFKEAFEADEAAAAVFRPGGRALEEGETLRQPDLARTLRRLMRKGPEEFYKGETARLIVEEMSRGGGLVSMEDLAGYKAVERRPITFRYRDLTVHSMPPPSSGGVAMAQILRVLEGFDLAGAGPLSADAVHWMVEAERQAYADRSRWLGDADFVDVPVGALLSPAYVKAVRRSIRGAEGKARSSSQVGPLTMVGYGSGQTTHYSVVDAEGGAVAVTYTLNSHYGCKVMVDGAGFFLNNQMDDFSVKPGHPNVYGLVGGAWNAIEPGKRPLSSMSPTVVERDGRLWAVLGSPGGSTIITTVVQVIVGLRDFGMELGRATAWPRFHHQWLPDRIDVEPFTLSPDTRRDLEERGYRFHERKAPIGDLQAILVAEDGTLQAAADPRGIGAALGH